MDEKERDRLKRERRRLQEQLRRVKRNEIRFDQYEKQKMLIELQQKNLALIESERMAKASAVNEPIHSHPNRIVTNFELNLSDDDDEQPSSSFSSTSPM